MTAGLHAQAAGRRRPRPAARALGPTPRSVVVAAVSRAVSDTRATATARGDVIVLYMADYVRRRIAPLLPGLEAEYLELIVGELEIATETRQCVSAKDDDDDVAAAVLDILEAAGYAASRAAAKVDCERILLQLELTGGSSLRSASEEKELAAVERCASAAVPTRSDAKSSSAPRAAPSAASTASEDQNRPSVQPSSKMPLCAATPAFAGVAVAVALTLLLLATPRRR